MLSIKTLCLRKRSAHPIQAARGILFGVVCPIVHVLIHTCTASGRVGSAEDSTPLARDTPK
eukprot:scaffold621656_cov41-Prasinocladus_malaysianus.AAC.1